MTNIHACLVHESPECVTDLVANLRFLDPESLVLIYDGSPGQQLVKAEVGTGIDGVMVHPNPHPMRWGRLHDFALDSLRLAMTIPEFTTMTIVDSDQLATRPGYSGYLNGRLRDDLGCLLAAEGGVQRSWTGSALARAASNERSLWRPLLRQVVGGEELFPQWTFWPSTVITRQATPDILRLADQPAVAWILSRTRLWATEEILLPTLAALSGRSVEVNPCSSDYLRYRVRYGLSDLQQAMQRFDVFWIHPVNRRYSDSNRSYVRNRHRGYARVHPVTPRASTIVPGAAATPTDSRLLVTLPLLKQMESIPGTLDPSEGDLLLAAARYALSGGSQPHMILLSGPDCQRSRLLLEAAVQALDPGGSVHQVERAETLCPSWAAVPMIVISGGGDFATTVEVFCSQEPCLVEAGLVAAGGVARAGGSMDGLTDLLVSMGVLSRLAQVGSLSILRLARRLALPKIAPLLALSERTEGWLSRDEAAFLALAAACAGNLPAGCIVEVGSYCGRATVVLAKVAQAKHRRVVAIDRFDGIVGEQGALHCGDPTLDKFRSSLAKAGVEGVVDVVQACTDAVQWNGHPIALLLVDGLHDKASVTQDFYRFAEHLVDGGLAAFHDYADYFPGVQDLVNELKASPAWRLVGVVDTLALFERDRSASATARSSNTSSSAARLLVRSIDSPKATTTDRKAEAPLVSCIMPTYNRPAFVELAISYFLRQDYERKELVIVDDGDESVEHLLPVDMRIRYARLAGRGTIGAKRNLACDLATGEIIAHWDDDDWYSPHRLTYQVNALTAHDVDVVGSNQLLYWAPTQGKAWRYAYPEKLRPWLHDPTLCYHKALWRTQPFPRANHALDSGWLWKSPRKRIKSLINDTYYVGIIHQKNTSRKLVHDPRWTSAPLEMLADVLGGDLERYAWAAPA